ncbi:MAG: hypothetical protein BGO01_00670 [Armatimonadetes bacterium 55-13]|nr:hypothetical protein [Armatimonadota bacterium]OJU62318.1 MAG: hypothetical protein BGO01_00670 [Armatimonadetes bacterium 55-13]
MQDEQGWVSIGVAAALSREYSVEGAQFVPVLSRLLLNALPDCTEPIMAGGFFSKKTLSGVCIQLGDFRYALEAGEKGGVLASRTHQVRGISLKSEPMSVDSWLGEVGAGIEGKMRENSRVRAALSELLELP